MAAASDLQFAFGDLATAFRDRHPDIAVEATFGSSGNFFAQLRNRAPFDLFLSADMDYPRRLAEEGLGLSDTLFPYAIGHLVVWVPRDSALDFDRLGAKALLEPSAHRIALANPRYAPYGRAAEAALKSLRVYEPLRDRLVFGETVAQAAQFVRSGAADAGLVGLSQALAPALREHGRFWSVPADAYPRLEQGGVILAWAADRAAAAALRDFLTGADGQAVLQRYGFRPPES